MKGSKGEQAIVQPEATWTGRGRGEIVVDEEVKKVATFRENFIKRFFKI